MNLPKRDVQISDAVRKNVPLLFGIFAIWDGGKTLSGIKVGRGMAEVLTGDPDNVYVIDTEGNRALAYAWDPERPDSTYKFQHVPFEPPHGSLDYLQFINTCVARGAKVIVVDTVTHEHYGIGGYLDTIEAAQDELVRRWKMPDTPQSHDKVKFSAINVAASRRKELVRNVEQLGRSGVAIIFCFRASEKVRPRKKGQSGGGGDDKMIEMGYMPDTKESLMFLMTASALLMPRAKGVPTWHPEKPGEQLMVKLPQQFASGVFRDGDALNEEHGRKMARWHMGGHADAVTPLRSQIASAGALVAEERAALDDRYAKARKFIAGAKASTIMKSRWSLPQTESLREELDVETRDAWTAEYQELLGNLIEREGMQA